MTDNDDLDKAYGALSLWAMNVIGNHQLTSATLVGMASGVAELLSNGGMDEADKLSYRTYYTVLHNVINMRIDEIKAYMNQINRLDIPLPDLDFDFMEEMAAKKHKIGKEAVLRSDVKGIKSTMDKVMNGLGEIKLDDED